MGVCRAVCGLVWVIVACIAAGSTWASADLSGRWTISARDEPLKTLEGKEPPLTDLGKSRMEEFLLARRKASTSVDPVERCLPPDIPRTYLMRQLFIIAQRPYLVMLMFQYQRVVMQIRAASL